MFQLFCLAFSALAFEEAEGNFLDTDRSAICNNGQNVKPDMEREQWVKKNNSNGERDVHIIQPQMRKE